MNHRILCLFICFISLFSSYVIAQTNPSSLVIINEKNQHTILSLIDVKNMPHITLQVKDHDEKIHSYSGVEMSVLLQKAGLSIKDSANKNIVSSYLFITASDGYKVVYALTEADTLLSDKRIILADKEDDKPLPDNTAPFQIIATGEKKQARMIRHVATIAIRKGY